MLKEFDVYAHIQNGGVTFKVTDDNGPTIEVIATHFGNTTNHIKLHVGNEVIVKLAEMFNKASDTTFSDEYSCAARLVGKSNGIGDSNI